MCARGSLSLAWSLDAHNVAEDGSETERLRAHGVVPAQATHGKRDATSASHRATRNRVRRELKKLRSELRIRVEHYMWAMCTSYSPVP